MSSTISRRVGALAATCGFMAYTAVMLLLEQRMRRSGGPGIIPFELAGNATRADQIMTRWGPDGQRAARMSLWLDFGYMFTYGALTALLLKQVRSVHGHPSVVPAVIIPALAADAVEGVSLLKVLKLIDVTPQCTSCSKRGHGQVRHPRLRPRLPRHRIDIYCMSLAFTVAHRLAVTTLSATS